MKTFKIAFFAIALCLCSTFSAQAQIIDSFPWFKAPGKFMTPRILEINTSYTLVGQRAAIKSNRSVNIADQRITLPPKVKELHSPVNLKKGNQSLEVYCARTSSCSDCTMLWYDRNGDRKIQPRQELRCVCQKGGDNCGIKARKTGIIR